MDVKNIPFASSGSTVVLPNKNKAARSTLKENKGQLTHLAGPLKKRISTSQNEYKPTATKTVTDLKNILNVSPGLSIIVPGRSEVACKTLNEKIRSSINLADSSKARPWTSQNEIKPTATKTTTSSVSGSLSKMPIIKASKTGRNRNKKPRQRWSTVPGDTSKALSGPSNVLSTPKTAGDTSIKLWRQVMDASDHGKYLPNKKKIEFNLSDLACISAPEANTSETFKSEATLSHCPTKASLEPATVKQMLTDAHATLPLLCFEELETTRRPSTDRSDTSMVLPDPLNISSIANSATETINCISKDPRSSSGTNKSFHYATPASSVRKDLKNMSIASPRSIVVVPGKTESDYSTLREYNRPSEDLKDPSKVEPCTSQNESQLTTAKTVTSNGAGSLNAPITDTWRTGRSRNKISRQRRSTVPGDTSLAFPRPSNVTTDDMSIKCRRQTKNVSDNANSLQNTTKTTTNLKDVESILTPDANASETFKSASLSPKRADLGSAKVKPTLIVSLPLVCYKTLETVRCTSTDRSDTLILPVPSNISSTTNNATGKCPFTMDIHGSSKEQSILSLSKPVTTSVTSNQSNTSIADRSLKYKTMELATDALFPIPLNIVPIKPKTTHRKSNGARSPSLVSSDTEKSLHSKITDLSVLKDLGKLQFSSLDALDHLELPQNTMKTASNLRDLESISIPEAHSLQALKSDASQSHCPVKAILEPAKVKPSLTVSFPLETARCTSTDQTDTQITWPGPSNVSSAMKITGNMSIDYCRRRVIHTSNSAKSLRNETKTESSLRYLECSLDPEGNASEDFKFDQTPSHCPIKAVMDPAKEKPTLTVSLPLLCYEGLETARHSSIDQSDKPRALPDPSNISSTSNSATSKCLISMNLPDSAEEQTILSSSKLVSSNFASSDASITHRSLKNQTRGPEIDESLSGSSIIGPIKPQTSNRRMLNIARSSSLDSVVTGKSLHSTTLSFSVRKDLKNISNVPGKTNYDRSILGEYNGPSEDLAGPSKVELCTSQYESTTAKTVTSSVAGSLSNVLIAEPSRTGRSRNKKSRQRRSSAPGDTSISLFGPLNVLSTHISIDCQRQAKYASDNATFPQNTTKTAFNLKDVESILTLEANASETFKSNASLSHCPKRADLEPAEVKPTLIISLPLVCYKALKTARRTSTDQSDKPLALLDPSNILSTPHNATEKFPVTMDKHDPFEEQSSPSPSKLITRSVTSNESDASITDQSCKNKTPGPATDTSLPGPLKIVLSKQETTHRVSKDAQSHLLDSSDAKESLHSATPATYVQKDLKTIPIASLPSLVVAVPGKTEYDRSILIEYNRPSEDLADLSKVEPCTSQNDSKPAITKTVTPIGANSLFNASVTEHSRTSRSRNKISRRRSTIPGYTSKALPGPLNVTADDTSIKCQRQAKNASEHSKSPQNTTKTAANLKSVERILTSEFNATKTCKSDASPSHYPKRTDLEPAKEKHTMMVSLPLVYYKALKTARSTSADQNGTSLALPDPSNMSSTPHNTTEKGPVTMDLYGPSEEQSSSSLSKPVISSVSNNQSDASITDRSHMTETPGPPTHSSLPGPVKIVPSKPKTTYRVPKSVRSSSFDSSKNAKSLHSAMSTLSVRIFFKDILKASPSSSVVVPSKTKSDCILREYNGTSVDLAGPSEVEPYTSQNDFKPTTTITVTSSGVGKLSKTPITEKSKTERNRNKKSRRPKLPGYTSFALALPDPTYVLSTLKTASRMLIDCQRQTMEASSNVKSPQDTIKIACNKNDLESSPESNAFEGFKSDMALDKTQRTTTDHTLPDPSKILSKPNITADKYQVSMDQLGPSKDHSEPLKSVSSGAAQSDIAITHRIRKYKTRGLTRDASLPGPSTRTSIKPKTTPYMSKDARSLSLDSFVRKYLKNMWKEPPGSFDVPGKTKSDRIILRGYNGPSEDLTDPSKVESYTSQHESNPTTTKRHTLSNAGSLTNAPITKPLRTGRSRHKKSRQRRTTVPGDSLSGPSNVLITLKPAGYMSIDFQCQTLDVSNSAKYLKNTTGTAPNLKDLESVFTPESNASKVFKSDEALEPALRTSTYHALLDPSNISSTPNMSADKCRVAIDMHGPTEEHSEPPPSKPVPSSVTQSEAAISDRSRKNQTLGSSTDTSLPGPPKRVPIEPKKIHRLSKDIRSSSFDSSTSAKSLHSVIPISSVQNDLENTSNAPPGSSIVVSDKTESDRSILRGYNGASEDLTDPSRVKSCASKYESKPNETTTTTSSGAGSNVPINKSSRTGRHRYKKSRQRRSSISGDTSIALFGPSNILSSPKSAGHVSIDCQRQTTAASDNAKSPENITTASNLKDVESFSTSNADASETFKSDASPSHYLKTAGQELVKVKPTLIVSLPLVFFKALETARRILTDQSDASVTFLDPSNISSTPNIAADKCRVAIDQLSHSESLPSKPVSSSVAQSDASITDRNRKNKTQRPATDASLPGSSIIGTIKQKTTNHMTKDAQSHFLDKSDAKESLHSATPVWSVQNVLENVLNTPPGSSVVALGKTELEGGRLKIYDGPSLDLGGPSKVEPCTSQNRSKSTTTKTIISSSAGNLLNAPITKPSRTGRSRNKKSRQRRSIVPGDKSIALLGSSNQKAYDTSTKCRREAKDASDLEKSAQTTTNTASNLKAIESISAPKANASKTFKTNASQSYCPKRADLESAKVKPTLIVSLPLVCYKALKTAQRTAADQSDTSLVLPDLSNISSTPNISADKCRVAMNLHGPTEEHSEPSEPVPSSVAQSETAIIDRNRKNQTLGSSSDASLPRQKTIHRKSTDTRSSSFDSTINAKYLHSATPALSYQNDLENISNAPPGSSVVVPDKTESHRSILKGYNGASEDLTDPSRVKLCASKYESKPNETTTTTSSGAGSNVPITESSRTDRSRNKKARQRRSSVPGDTSISLSGSSNVLSTPKPAGHILMDCQDQTRDASDHPKSSNNTTKTASNIKSVLTHETKLHSSKAYKSDEALETARRTITYLALPDLSNILSTPNIADKCRVTKGLLGPSGEHLEPSPSKLVSSSIAQPDSAIADRNRMNKPRRPETDALLPGSSLIGLIKPKTCHRMARDARSSSLDSSDTEKYLRSKLTASSVQKDLKNISSPVSLLVVPGKTESKSGRSKITSLDVAGPSKVEPCTSQNKSKLTTTKTFTSSDVGSLNASIIDPSRTGRSQYKKSRHRRSTVPGDTSLAFPRPSNVSTDDKSIKCRRQTKDSSDHTKSPLITTKTASNLKDVESISTSDAGACKSFKSDAMPCLKTAGQVQAEVKPTLIVSLPLVSYEALKNRSDPSNISSTPR